MRAPNAIDFWRGVALVMIFINHIPGMAFSLLTLRNYAISDAAELFVFLAGCSLAFVAAGNSGLKPAGSVVWRLVLRAFEIWRAQIVTISVALALLGAGALLFNDPSLLRWHQAGAAFSDTVRASVGLVLLTYQIGYFNILPLYVVLLLLALVFVMIARRSLAAALAASVALYAATLTWQIQLPSWPIAGAWFFNPLSWQLLVMLGFAAVTLKRNDPEAWRAMMAWAWPVSLVVVALGAGIVWIDYRPEPSAVPAPRFFFLFDKQYLSPVRILNMIAVAIAFYPLFPRLARMCGPAVRFCSSLGRNSLAVFCVASLLALAGQIARHVGQPNLLFDTGLVVAGLVLMRATAWVAEWAPAASRSPAPLQSPAPSPSRVSSEEDGRAFHLATAEGSLRPLKAMERGDRQGESLTTLSSPIRKRRP